MKKISFLVSGLLMGVSMIVAQNIVDFEELNLEPESYWNGSDESGSFTSKYLKFYNEYDSQWGTWGGFSYTNQTDNTTYDWTNMYSSASGSGAFDSENYAIAYYADFFEKPSIKINPDLAPEVIQGMYISLNAYASLYMADSDYYQNENHWLKLFIKAYNSVLDYEIEKEIILADYRFENTEGYKFDDWHYIDMTWIEDADSLVFWFESSDTGDWGINTPAYFCLDDINADAPQTYPDFITEISDDITIEQGENAELLVLAKGGIQAYSYEWNNTETLNNGFIQNPVASPDITTIYSVTVTDAAGNSNIETVKVNVNTNNISTYFTEKSGVYVCQSGLINISSNQNIKSVSVYDIQGKKLFKSPVNSNEFAINSMIQNSALYIVKIVMDKNVETHKVYLK